MEDSGFELEGCEHDLHMIGDQRGRVREGDRERVGGGRGREEGKHNRTQKSLVGSIL